MGDLINSHLSEEAASTQFRARLAQEMLLSQRLRTTILACLFLVAAIFLLTADILSIFNLNPFKVNAPIIVQVIVVGMAVYEFAMRQFINRQIKQHAGVPIWLGYLNAFIEISVLTLVIIFARGVFVNPIYALSIPAVVAYFLFIILSTLYLDFRLSLFTGFIAASEFLAVALYTVSSLSASPTMDPIFSTPMIYSAKALILLMGGAGAAFVAFELHRRMMNSFSAIEDRNRTQQASEFKSRFLANMSHEIRTPLNAILGHTQLMEADHELTQQQRQAVRTIASSGNHLLSVINDVLDLSKIEAGREELHQSAFDLNTLVQELSAIFKLQCSQKGLAWHLEWDIIPNPVLGDETKLRQTLTNLLGNAVKFTNTGSVTLQVSALPDSYFTFEVIDTGPGIPKAEQESIFDPFTQETQGHLKGGTGLGLAISSRHVEMMGGRLQFDTGAPTGARFYFSVPLPSSIAEQSAHQTEPFSRVSHLAPGQKVKAFVIDDVAENRDVLVKFLHRIGVDVKEFESGEAALKAFRIEQPDIVFLDMRMPGLSGPETLQRMRDAHSASADSLLKFVAVSASALAHERAGFLELGFDAFIDKPVRMPRVYAVLADLLDVELTFESETRSGSDQGSKLNLNTVKLSKQLHESLNSAVQAHNMTDLKQHLDALEASGLQERQLANRLRELSRQYDMKAMQDILNEISHG